MLVGFVCVSFVTTGSLLNGLAMCLVGVLLGQIGTDVEQRQRSASRWTSSFLADGIGLVSIALGCFGIAEITKNLDNKERALAVQRQDQADADLARVQAHHPERAARQRRSARSSASCPAAGR